MWPFGKRIESVFRAFYFLGAKALIINYENRVRGQVGLCRILDGIFVTGQCGKGCKLGCSVPHRHPRMMFRLIVWQIDNIVVIVSHALCPPICLLRSLAVAPSSKFSPLRMAFLPKRCLIFNCASCIRRSLSSLACSS